MHAIPHSTTSTYYEKEMTTPATTFNSECNCSSNSNNDDLHARFAARQALYTTDDLFFTSVSVPVVEQDEGTRSTLVDPLEILQASLTFEKSIHERNHVRSFDTNEAHGYLPTSDFPSVPVLSTIGRGSSSVVGSSSLYPSLEWVERTASDFDNFDLEESWRKAAAADSSSNRSDADSTADSKPAAVVKTNGQTCQNIGPCTKSHLLRSSSVGATMGSQTYPHSDSVDIAFDEAALTTSNGTTGIAAVFPETALSSSFAATSMAPSHSDTPSAASEDVLRRIRENNKLPALGSPTQPSAASTNFLSSDELDSRGLEMENVAYIPIEPPANSEDADLIALKMAAYGGGMGDYVVNNQAASVTVAEADQTAEATVIEYGFIHPLEDESVVQAEFVRQSEYDHHIDATGHSDVFGQEQHSRSDTERATASSCGPSDNTLATEATVIASGPEEKATAAAWSASTAVEATVLPQEERGYSFPSVEDLGTKPPAIPVIHEEEVSVMPLEQAVINNLNQQTVFVCGDNMSSEALATVVEYDVHPADMQDGSVQAEFLGNSAVDTGIESASDLVSSATSSTFVENIVHGDEVSTPTTEATVVDSGPVGKATAEAWSTGVAEEAHVLAESQNMASGVHNLLLHDTNASAIDGIVNMESMISLRTEAAEVVSISESIHPSEFISEPTNTAELVGTDTGHQRHPTSISSTTGADTSTTEVVIVEDSIPAATAEATLVEVEAFSQRASFTHQTPSVSTIHYPVQQFDVTDRHTEMVTAVAVLEVEENAPATTEYDLFDFPEKPFLPHRAQSEPVRPTTERSHRDDRDIGGTSSSDRRAPEPSIGEEWIQTPSFGELNDDSIPPPIEPPSRIRNLVEYSSSAPPAIPAPCQHDTADSTSSEIESARVDSRSRSDGRSESHGGVQIFTNNLARGINNGMEMLFGNTRAGIARKPISFEMDSLTATVLPRTLLPSSVIYSEATQSWVATVNTNQKALDGNNVEESSKALRAFSVPTKKQAICLARAWAPPRMHPFGSNPNCFICETQFAVFRRACHCRNCGVCVCNSCSLQWPAKMLPATYNIKREGTVNICKACDWLCTSFRLALLNGDFDKAIVLFETGNINLTTPFANVKGELFYPVHCAVLGGNLNLLKWLVDEHCCPLRSIRVSSGKQCDANSGSYTPILTSKGRSLLNIALSARNVGIVRYLVVDKRMLLWAEKELSLEVLVQNLDLVLRILPEETLDGQQAYEHAQESGVTSESHSSRQFPQATAFNSTEPTSSLGSLDTEMVAAVRAGAEPGDEVTLGHHDECIICFSNPIDCVVTPCGHQICCLQCSNNITRCPVCCVECSFIRVFRA